MVEDRSHENALRVARLVAKGDQMTLEILLSRPVYAIAEENVASMASREADGVVEEKLRVDGVKRTPNKTAAVDVVAGLRPPRRR